jgi:dihydroorotate dehydrogenase (fumarate)
MDLSTDYLGLHLLNPIVISASPLQRDLDNIRRMEDAGAAAVVLHSLFEEQIDIESKDLSLALDEGSETNAEGLSYHPDLRDYNLGPEPYLEHIARVKKATGIPIVASLNGVSLGGWTRYARLMQEAGADALELNLYFLPTDITLQPATLENQYCEVVQSVKSSLTIPLAVKISPFFTCMPNILQRLDNAGADALVLFNRFYQPDFDIEALEISPRLNLSTSAELPLRLNWVAIAYGHVNADLAITGGVHTPEDVLKSMMAGAKVAMMTSAILEKGIPHVTEVLTGVRAWMEEHEYDSIRLMQGSLSRGKAPHPANFERANYMRVLSSFPLGYDAPIFQG